MDRVGATWPVDLVASPRKLPGEVRMRSNHIHFQLIYFYDEKRYTCIMGSPDQTESSLNPKSKNKLCADSPIAVKVSII